MSTTSTLEQKFSRLTMLNLQIADSENQQLKKAVEWRTQLANECLILISELLKEEKEKAVGLATCHKEEPEGLTEAEAVEAELSLNNPQDLSESQ
jgi:hypothetical protein